MRPGWARIFKRWVRYQYLRVLRINDSPEKVAGGFAFGVVIGILPTFGLGVLIALFAAGPLKVNKAAAVIGTLVVNPWTAPFFWTLSYLTGSLMLGNNLTETIDAIKNLQTEGDLWENILGRRLILPYIAGNAAVTAASAATSYVASFMAVKAYRKAKKKKRLKRQGVKW